VSSAEPRLWVVDASVAFGWFVEVPGSAKAVELLNAGWKAWRVGAITEEQFAGIAQLAHGLFTELVPASNLLASARRWSQRLDHPAYDCLYLALAEARNSPLITQDQRLLKRLAKDPQTAGLALDLQDWRA
jgi:predicted nucleic acid-binding protein